MPVLREVPFLVGARIALRPLGPADATSDYLRWLNDPAVLRYRAPKAFPTTSTQLRSWIASLPDRGDLVLAIRLRRGDRHVGNIALNTIQWPHRCAELSILLGAKDVWGRGLGREAIGLLTDHAFTAMGLNRVWAESPNPAFNRSVEGLGWTKEGIKREALLVDGAFADLVCWGLLRAAWRAGAWRHE
jgi:[ribosomal protein S5]-alanine N-acetyltransferase